MEYISIRQILDNLLEDPMMKDLSLERAVNYAVEFIKIVGMPSVFEDKNTIIKVCNYRAILPCDFYEMVQVKDLQGRIFMYSTTSFDIEEPLTYKIQGTALFTSKKEDELEITYRAFKKDEDGFPLIVDNGTFGRALELYIQKRWFGILFNSNKVTQNVLQHIEQEYAFAVGQAQSDLIRPTIDQMQSITNFMTALLPRTRAHSRGFANLSEPEIRRF